MGTIRGKGWSSLGPQNTLIRPWLSCIVVDTGVLFTVWHFSATTNTAFCDMDAHPCTAAMEKVSIRLVPSMIVDIFIIFFHSWTPFWDELSLSSNWQRVVSHSLRSAQLSLSSSLSTISVATFCCAYCCTVKTACFDLQCLDAVGWAAGRASGL